jgi:hypothetical protein
VQASCGVPQTEDGQDSDEARELREKSLFGTGNERGLPIGNLTSQFWANVYLDELDHFVKRTLRCQFYVRYVDDLVLLDKSQKLLARARLAVSVVCPGCERECVMPWRRSVRRCLLCHNPYAIAPLDEKIFLVSTRLSVVPILDCSAWVRSCSELMISG